MVPYRDGTVRFHENNGTLLFTVGNLQAATFQIIRANGEILFDQVVCGNMNYAYQFAMGTEPTGPRICRYTATPGDGKWRVIHMWEWDGHAAQTLFAYEQLGVAADEVTKAFNQFNEAMAAKPSLYAPEFADYYGLE